MKLLVRAGRLDPTKRNSPVFSRYWGKGDLYGISGRVGKQAWWAFVIWKRPR